MIYISTLECHRELFQPCQVQTQLASRSRSKACHNHRLQDPQALGQCAMLLGANQCIRILSKRFFEFRKYKKPSKMP